MRAVRLLASSASLALALFGPGAHADDRAPLPPGPPIHDEARFRMPEVKEARLSNGARVLFVERHDVPLVSVHVVSTLGASDAPPGVAELAAGSALSSTYFSHWMRTTHPFNMIGAHLAAYANHHLTGASTHAMAFQLEEALADLAELVRAQFPDDDIVRQERDATLDRLATAEQSSAGVAVRALLYPAENPYHYDEAGTAASIRRLDRAALREFWGRAFTASNVTITASGDASFDRLLKALEASFGTMPRGAPVPPSAPAASPLDARKAVVLMDLPSTTQARVAVAALGAPRRSADGSALSLAASALEGLLRDRVRETYGSSYGVHAGLDSERGDAPLWAIGSIENDGVRVALTEILRSFADVRAGNVDLEGPRARRFREIARAFETSPQTASLLAEQGSLGVGVDDLRSLPERLRAVTIADVKRVTAERFDPSRLRVVVIGDAARLKPELEKLGIGPVEVRALPRSTAR